MAKIADKNSLQRDKSSQQQTQKKKLLFFSFDDSTTEKHVHDDLKGRKQRLETDRVPFALPLGKRDGSGVKGSGMRRWGGQVVSQHQHVSPSLYLHFSSQKMRRNENERKFLGGGLVGFVRPLFPGEIAICVAGVEKLNVFENDFNLFFRFFRFLLQGICPPVLVFWF